MDSHGEIVQSFTCSTELNGEWYRNTESIGVGNLLRIEYWPSGFSSMWKSYKLVNPDQRSISEKYYLNIVKADENTVYAMSCDDNDDYFIDVYNQNGKLVRTLQFDTNFVSIGDDNSVIATITNEPPFYIFYTSEKDEKFSYSEGYTHILPLENFWIIKNKYDQYALLDQNGLIRIPFGELRGESGTNWDELEIKSYNGQEIVETYVFDDTFCIVTKNDQGVDEENYGCDIWLF